MDDKQQRLAEAHRLNAIDDLKAHIRKLDFTIMGTPRGDGRRAIMRSDMKKVERVLKYTEANNRRKADSTYQMMDTTPREAIPETFDKWLAASRES